MKIKKKDQVRVMVGKDRGKEGAVTKVWPKQGKVAIDGVNAYKRHLRPRGEGQKGQITTLYRCLDVSKIALICPKCKQPTRVGYKLGGEKSTRICRKCESEI